VEHLVAEFRDEFKKLRDEVGKMIVGQREIVEGVLVCLFAGGHSLLEACRGWQDAAHPHAVGGAQPRLCPHSIYAGPHASRHHRHQHHHRDAATGRRHFEFQRGPLFGQMILADEINRATPKTQSALLEAMQEHTVTSSGTKYTLKEPFFVMATQNPIEQEGHTRCRRPSSTGSSSSCSWYSDREELKLILERTTTGTSRTSSPC